MVDRRHRHQLVDAVRADRLEEALEVQRARQDLHAAAELEHRDQLAVAAGHVEQRHRHERGDRRSLRASGVQAAKRVLAVGQEVAVGGHRALGKAGGAAGVEDRRQVLGGEILARHRLAVRQRRARLERVRRARVLDHVRHLLLGEARVHGHHHRAQRAARRRTRAPSRCRCPGGSPRDRRGPRRAACRPPATRAARSHSSP